MQKRETGSLQILTILVAVLGTMVWFPLGAFGVSVDPMDDIFALEGSPITFSGSVTGDPPPPLYYSWDYDDGNTSAGINLWDPVHAYGTDGEYRFMLTVQENYPDGGTDDETAIATIANANPTVDAGTNRTVGVGQPVVYSGSFTDPGYLDDHYAQWIWDDGGVTGGSVSEVSGSGTVTDPHTYALEGVYNITLTVWDYDGGVDVDEMTVTVVPEPASMLILGALGAGMVAARKVRRKK